MLKRGKNPFLLDIDPTTVLLLLVLIDMFSVSLVVPLLQQYYRNAGITSASQRELLSSIYTTSQIFGGLFIGYLSDTHILSQNRILLLSFIGSAISYGSLGYGKVLGVKTLIFSRILVGLVKQTMTVSMGMLVSYTSKEERASKLGRLNASVTVAWIVGPGIGAFLYKNVHPSTPALLACFLFCVNIVLGILCLPPSSTSSNKIKRISNDSNTGHDDIDKEETSSDSQSNAKKKNPNKFASFTTNIQSCFSSPMLGSVIISLLLFTWVRSATSYKHITSYYEQQYHLEIHQRGYLTSYQSILTFLAQSFLIQPLLKFLDDGSKNNINSTTNTNTKGGQGRGKNGEQKAAYIGAFFLGIIAFTEIYSSLTLFLAILSPIIAIAYAIMDLSLRSLITQIAPKSSINSVLAALDVLQNATAVTVPFYRTFLFSFLMPNSNDRFFEGNTSATSSVITGDPDPRKWLLSSSMHWFVSSIVFYFLLRRKSDNTVKNQEGTSKSDNKED